MIRPEDDSFHPHLPGADDPYWNESSWFGISLPERNINGWVYFFHRPNMKLSVGGVALWDGNGEDIYDCLFHEFDLHQALPPGSDMFDFSLREGHGLTVSLKEPLKTYHLVYEGDCCSVDLIWDAINEPVEQRHPESDFAKRVAAHGDPSVVNPSMAAWGPAHYEHFGRLRGTIDLEGERIEVDTFSIHDHSWGPRQGGKRPRFLRGDLHQAVASESSFFSLMANSRIPFDDDPVFGTTEAISYGFYAHDGLIGHLVSGQSTVVERSPTDGRPIRAVIDAVDEHGRQFHAEGIALNALKWMAYTTYFSYWCLAKWDFDGQTGYGEIVDYFHVSQNRRLQRSLRGQ
jgi:hypothetical protein